MRTFVFISFIFCLTACSTGYPDKIDTALSKAGSNRRELTAVILHYQEPEDSLKLKAAYFLISNMNGHYSYKGALVDGYDSVFHFAASRMNARETHIDWDSLEKVFCSGKSGAITKAPDLENISSDYLIKNIDEAFKVWELPLAGKMSFHDFCEYILPYRISNEPLVDWRSIASARYAGQFDSANKAPETTIGCDIINDDLKK